MILEIIAEQDIETQDELCAELVKRNFNAFQFMRQGYFCPDSRDSKPGALVFNRAVSLKDSFKM